MASAHTEPVQQSAPPCIPPASGTQDFKRGRTSLQCRRHWSMPTFDPELRVDAVPLVLLQRLVPRGQRRRLCWFYSRIDCLLPTDGSIEKSLVRRLALRLVQRNPWLRSMALLQFGNAAFMMKRSEP